MVWPRQVHSKSNSIADADDKIADHIQRDGEVPTDQLQHTQDVPRTDIDGADAKLVNEPREEPRHRPRQQLREHDPFGRADEKRAGFHSTWFSASVFLPAPDFARNRNSRISSTAPKAILAS